MSDRLSEVRLRCEDHPDEVCTIGRPAGGADGFHTVPILLEANGLTCSREATSYGDDGIRAFFAGVAADWQGWAGTRTWTTLEHDLAIEATHTGRRVELALTLRRDTNDDAWRVSVAISLPPGESLSRLATDIDELFEDR